MAGKLRAHAWPWFLLGAVLMIVGFIVHGSILESLLRSAAVFVVLGGCIRLVGLMVRDNPTSAEMVTKRSIEAGVTGWMAEDSGARRKRRAAQQRADADADAPDSPDS